MAVKPIKNKQHCYSSGCILNAFSIHGDLHTFASDLHHNLVRELFCFIFTIGRYPSSERTHNLLITIYVYLVAEADSKVSLTPSWFQSPCPLHELPLETLILLLINVTIWKWSYRKHLSVNKLPPPLPQEKMEGGGYFRNKSEILTCK